MFHLPPWNVPFLSMASSFAWEPLKLVHTCPMWTHESIGGIGGQTAAAESLLGQPATPPDWARMVHHGNVVRRSVYPMLLYPLGDDDGIGGIECKGQG